MVEVQVLKEVAARDTTAQTALLGLFGLETQDNSQAHEQLTNNLSIFKGAIIQLNSNREVV